MTKIRNLFLITGIAIMLISIGIAYGQGVPQSITELESTFAGFEVFLTDLNNQVQDHETRITTLESTSPTLDITDHVQSAQFLAGDTKSIVGNCPVGKQVISLGWISTDALQIKNNGNFTIHHLFRDSTTSFSASATNNDDVTQNLTIRILCGKITP